MVDKSTFVADHLLSESEDDTKSTLQLIRVYNSIMFYHGTQKEDFDGRWKSLHIVKKSMENRVGSPWLYVCMKGWSHNDLRWCESIESFTLRKNDMWAKMGEVGVLYVSYCLSYHECDTKTVSHLILFACESHWQYH